jgi:hypothetical protein
MEFWRRHFLGLELGAATGVAVVALIITEFGSETYWLSAILGSGSGGVASALVGISASLLGFTITAISLLLVLPDSSGIQRLRTSGSWEIVLHVFMSAIGWTGLLLVCALAASLGPDTGQLKYWLSAGCFFLSVVVLLRYLRIVWILEHIVQLAVGRVHGPPAKAALRDEAERRKHLLAEED